jgi:peptidoglycan/xylan/chitin deacetylase (PgdA/CDA1 family)
VNLHLPGGIRVSRTLRQWRSRLQPGAAILGYHRVSDALDPLGLSVSTAHFREQLEVLARVSLPVTLADVAGAIARGRVPRRALVLTFDDGYEDNLRTVLPLLRAHRIPMTVFVTSGNRGGEFWWDRLARIQAARETEGEAYRVAAELERLQETERAERIRALETGGPPLPRPVHRSMTVDELREIADDPLVEIGAHGESHSPLPGLSADEQRTETRRSRVDLERLIGKPVTSFAYPHGAISAETVEIVREAGYAVACCSKSDVATAASPVLALPRLWVRNEDGRSFERWLRGWLHG